MSKGNNHHLRASYSNRGKARSPRRYSIYQDNSTSFVNEFKIQRLAKRLADTHEEYYKSRDVEKNLQKAMKSKLKGSLFVCGIEFKFTKLRLGGSSKKHTQLYDSDCDLVFFFKAVQHDQFKVKINHFDEVYIDLLDLIESLLPKNVKVLKVSRKHIKAMYREKKCDFLIGFDDIRDDPSIYQISKKNMMAPSLFQYDESFITDRGTKALSRSIVVLKEWQISWIMKKFKTTRAEAKMHFAAIPGVVWEQLCAWFYDKLHKQGRIPTSHLSEFMILKCVWTLLKELSPEKEVYIVNFPGKSQRYNDLRAYPQMNTFEIQVNRRVKTCLKVMYPFKPEKERAPADLLAGYRSFEEIKEQSRKALENICSAEFKESWIIDEKTLCVRPVAKSFRESDGKKFTRDAVDAVVGNTLENHYIRK